jgi:Kef-type K+ transport system membrane component KefB
MHGVAALLAAAAIGYTLARALSVPAIPLLLLAGVSLSFVHPVGSEVLQDGLVLGVSFLLFIGGLELDPRRIRAQRGAAFRVGTAQFFVLAAAGFAAARLLGFGSVEAGYLALGLTASSTLVGIRLLQRRRQLFEPFGRLILGVLLLQDLMVLLLIPLVTELGRSLGLALLGIGAVAALLGLSLLARRWVGPLLIRLARHDEELVLLGALAVLFLFLGSAAALGVPIVVGAFLAGMALSRFPVQGIVQAELAPIGDFFTAIFFTALGALVRFPTATELGQAAVLGLLVVVLTPPLVAVLAERVGFSAKPAIEAGLLLSQTSEISLVIALTGILHGHIGSDVFTILALVTLGTMLLTPLLTSETTVRRLMRWHPGRRRAEAPPPRGHILLLGVGSTGMPLLEDLILTGSEIVVVDDDPAVGARLEEAGIRTVRGDAGDAEVLRHAGAADARVVGSTIRRVSDNAALLELAAGVPILVRVFDEEEASWVRERGGVPVISSVATAEGFMDWFEEERDELARSLAARLKRPAP